MRKMCTRILGLMPSGSGEASKFILISYNDSEISENLHDTNRTKIPFESFSVNESRYNNATSAVEKADTIEMLAPSKPNVSFLKRNNHAKNKISDKNGTNLKLYRSEQTRKRIKNNPTDITIINPILENFASLRKKRRNRNRKYIDEFADAFAPSNFGNINNDNFQQKYQESPIFTAAQIPGNNFRPASNQELQSPDESQISNRQYDFSGESARNLYFGEPVRNRNEHEVNLENSLGFENEFENEIAQAQEITEGGQMFEGQRQAPGDRVPRGRSPGRRNKAPIGGNRNLDNGLRDGQITIRYPTKEKVKPRSKSKFANLSKGARLRLGLFSALIPSLADVLIGFSYVTYARSPEFMRDPGPNSFYDNIFFWTNPNDAIIIEQGFTNGLNTLAHLAWLNVEYAFFCTGLLVIMFLAPSTALLENGGVLNVLSVMMAAISNLALSAPGAAGATWRGGYGTSTNWFLIRFWGGTANAPNKPDYWWPVPIQIPQIFIFISTLLMFAFSRWP